MIRWCSIFALLGQLVTGSAHAVELKIGDLAPPFELPGSDGKTYRLADFHGKKTVIVAWFPMAFTPG